MENKEIWKDIPEYEGYYQASNMGNIRSLDRTVTTKNGIERFYRGKFFSCSIDKGYRVTILSVKGKKKGFKVSQLVAMAFLEHKPNGFKDVVDHINGDRADDRVENLQIVTTRANSSTCYRSDRGSFISKFVGVNWNRENSKWRTQIYYEDRNIHLGCFDCELKASEAYQSALAKINDGTFNPVDYRPTYVSKYKGVTFNKHAQKFTARIQLDGIVNNLGSFKTELEAYNALQEFKKTNI